MHNYVETYNIYKKEFQKCFGEEAEEFWRIWKLNRLENIPMEYIAETNPVSYKKVRSIIKKVDSFLIDPEFEWQMKGYSISELNGPNLIPKEIEKEFIGMPMEIDKVVRVAIYLHNHNMLNRIPRQIMLEISSRYKQVKNRVELLQELQTLQMMNIKVFESVCDDRGAIIFKFTEEFTERIDIWKGFDTRIVTVFS